MGLRPYVPIYTGDLLRSNVLECSPGARYLYLMLQLIAADQERYGFLSQVGNPIPSAKLAAKCHLPEMQFVALFTELRSICVPAVNSEGIYYFPDMVQRESVNAVARQKMRRFRSKRNSSKVNAKEQVNSCKPVTDNVTVTLLEDGCSSNSSKDKTETEEKKEEKEKQAKEKDERKETTTDRLSLGFLEVFKNYPKQTEPLRAKTLFLAVPEKQWGRLRRAAQNYAEYCKTERKEERFIKSMVTFLNGNAWEDWVDYAPKPPPPERKVFVMTAEEKKEMERRLECERIAKK